MGAGGSALPTAAFSQCNRKQGLDGDGRWTGGVGGPRGKRIHPRERESAWIHDCQAALQAHPRLEVMTSQEECVLSCCQGPLRGPRHGVG